MPILEPRTLTLENYVLRIINHKKFGISESIVISSDFQRGDEETGVWTSSSGSNLIDSIQRNFPIGNITLVKEHQSTQPWMVLDGGNRSRSIRDYYLNNLTDENGLKFDDLDADEKAKLKNIYIQITWITIEYTDPPDTISKMFTRLNTSACNLSHGELIKAHGWKGNVPEIEMAKAIIRDGWNFNDSDERITALHNKWKGIGETKRCDNLAMLCGFIISAKTSKFDNYRNEYCKISSKFTNPSASHEDDMNDEKKTLVINKLNEFLDIMNKIPTKSSMGRIKKGMYPKTNVSPIWKRICEGTMTTEFKKKLIKFYKKMDNDPQLFERYKNTFACNGNQYEMRGVGGARLIDNVIALIENFQ